MKRVDSICLLLSEINSCLQHGNSLAALYIAVSLPDVCANLMDSKVEGKKARYKEWFDKYVLPYVFFKPKDVIINNVDFNSCDCWRLRCYLYHEGNYDIEYDKCNEFLLNFNKSAVLSTGNVFCKNKRSTKGNMNFDSHTYIKKTINVHYLCEIIIKSVNDFLKEPYLKDIKMPTFKIGSIDSFFKVKFAKNRDD